MKKALIGISNNIVQNKQKIKIWAESFRKFSDGDVILLAANSTEEDINICKELNIVCHPVHVEDTWYINNTRLKHTVEYLKNSTIDAFVVTDVFDVIFQADPFTKMDFDNYDLFVSGEGILVREEPWNSDVLNKCYPEEMETCRPFEVICSGVMAGKREPLISMLQQMHDVCEAGINNHNIRDQAALIILLANGKIPNVKIFNLTDGWAMHCAAAGPTNFFDAWGFKGIIESRYGIPQLLNTRICTADEKIYDIVHQFNRVPHWHEILINSYE